MISTAVSPQDYIDGLSPEHKNAMVQLRETLVKNLPEGFSEGMSYGMLCYGVPHSRYPQGYHCKPKEPLPFVSLASQKNFIALYHMGLMAMPDLLSWFQEEYPKHSKRKLDMGKSCIRFKKPDEIPFGLLGELVKKVSPDDWIAVYESQLKK